MRSILCPLYLDQNKRIYYDRDKFIESLPEPLRTNFAAGIRDRIMTIDEYLDLVERIRDGLHKEIDEGWVEVQLHPNGGQWCSDEALLRMKEYALAHGMYIHLHLLETQYQAEYARRTWGKSFIQHYQDIGFLGPWVSFAPRRLAGRGGPAADRRLRRPSGDQPLLQPAAAQRRVQHAPRLRAGPCLRHRPGRLRL